MQLPVALAVVCCVKKAFIQHALQPNNLIIRLRGPNVGFYDILTLIKLRAVCVERKPGKTDGGKSGLHDSPENICQHHTRTCGSG